MKRYSKLAAVVLALCLAFTSIYFFPCTASAKGITSVGQVKKLAKKQVKGARILEVEEDEKNGQAVYDVEMKKGKKEYKLVYRISDRKLVSYEWELKSRYVRRMKGSGISEEKAEKLAKKQAKKAEVTSIARKRSSGSSVYRVKMEDKNKKYEVKVHARSGAIVEYEWELITRKNKNKNKNKDYDDVDDDDDKDDDEDIDHKGDKEDKDSNGAYIGESRAKEIALDKVGGGTVVKAKFDIDDGVAVYEIEIRYGDYEYEVEINAKTGKILKYESKYEPVPDTSGGDGAAEYIGIEAARQVALDKVGAGTVTKAKFDMEDGQPVYEIEIIEGEFEYELEIHAITGNVLKFEKESIYD